MKSKQNQKNLIILLGRSGSGKGTQAEKLIGCFKNEKSLEFMHTTTGGNFREFLMEDNLSATLAKNIVNNGELMPEFLSIWNWSNIFINQIKDGTNIILDGAPRRLIELHALHSAVNYYHFNPIVIYIDVTRDWATKRLVERGRDDDKNAEEINKKMDWFDSEVSKVIDWYSEDPAYYFIHVNGEKTVDEVAEEIKVKLKSVRGNLYN